MDYYDETQSEKLLTNEKFNVLKSVMLDHATCVKFALDDNITIERVNEVVNRAKECGYNAGFVYKALSENWTMNDKKGKCKFVGSKVIANRVDDCPKCSGDGYFWTVNPDGYKPTKCHCGSPTSRTFHNEWTPEQLQYIIDYGKQPVTRYKREQLRTKQADTDCPCCNGSGKYLIPITVFNVTREVFALCPCTE